MRNGQRIVSIIRSPVRLNADRCPRIGGPLLGRHGKFQQELLGGIQWCGFNTSTRALIEKSHVVPRNRSQSLPTIKNVPAYPTVVQQALDNMQRYKDCVLLTRVGSFYELYFEQAQKYGPLLNLKVAAKVTAAGEVPMSGFPFYQLDRFLKTLVQDLGEHVAISEEFANDVVEKVKSGGLMFDRRVARVVTPGTLIDEKFLDGLENNFLLAVHEAEVDGSQESCGHTPLRKVGLAWLDLSTGDFFTQEVDYDQLASVASRVGAKEVVVDSGAATLIDLMKTLSDGGRVSVTKHRGDTNEISIGSWSPLLDGEMTPEVQASFTRGEVCAGQLLLSYVQDRLHGSHMRLQVPIRKEEAQSMAIDGNSMRALEILATSKEGYGKGSLFHSIRRTVTRSGSRLLRDWISAPSMSLQTINSRLDLVSIFTEDATLAERVIVLLKRSFDSQRLVQKFSLGRGDADDLVSVSKTINVTGQIAELLGQRSTGSFAGVNAAQMQSLSHLHRRLSLEGPHALAKVIDDSIDEQGLMESHRVEQEDSGSMLQMAKEILDADGTDEDRSSMKRITNSKAKVKGPSEFDGEDQKPWIIRRSSTYVLDDLHSLLDQLLSEKEELTDRLRHIHNAQSLTLRWTPGLGHICHIKGRSKTQNTSPESRLLKATKSTSSIHDPAWSKLGGQIDQARLRIRAEERRVLQDLRSQVVMNLIALRRNAAILDELDIACAFATLAREQSLVRPVLHSGHEHHIVRGRHPTVKQSLEEDGRAFVSNDCHLGDGSRIWLITGPNMAGKSTFLRQNALIAILAQAGAFVPAEHANLGLIDRMFTRVGSADNLSKDQSTFMVEMMETATILRQATPRSFVIMDEIGRGTTPEDGIAIGYACLNHLYHHNRCRTIFATHFHVLTDMTKHMRQVECHCTDVAENPDGSFSFIHRLRAGVNRSSHALKVAALAGLPQSAIDTAHNVLKTMEHSTSSVSASRPSQALTAG